MQDRGLVRPQWQHRKGRNPAHDTQAHSTDCFVLSTSDEHLAARISQRKLDHLELALGPGIEGPSGAGWDDVVLVHDCLPEVDMDEIDLSTRLFDYPLAAPLWITGMTGGHERAEVINRRLGAAARRHGLAMGVGSQRAGLAAETLMTTYAATREEAPDAMLIANIGAPQLISQGTTPALSLNDIERILASIGAQALAIHLNFLQEVVQPEGDRQARGCIEAIAAICAVVSVPVMAKETGAGISRERARSLVAAGVSAIDVGGAGGTSMVRIEGRRAERMGDGTPISAAFDGWGIPTAAAILETRDCGVPVIATGGVRSGLDAAKALALGAHMVGIGLPFLAAAYESESRLNEAISRFLLELKLALFLTGSRTPRDIRSRRLVLRGETRNWFDQIGRGYVVAHATDPIPQRPCDTSREENPG